MGLREQFTQTIQQVAEASKGRPWRPGVEWLGSEGTITTDAIQGDPSWDAVLRKWDLDPAEFQIVEPVLFNTWGGDEGLNNRQFKAKVIRRSSSVVDLEPLVRDALRRKPSRVAPSGDVTLVAVLADWQIGKADGDGVEGTIRRIVERRDALVQRVRDLRKIRGDIGRLAVLWTGDSIEGCMGFYPSQTFAVELDRRDQIKATRRLLSESLQEWARHFSEVTVLAVGGNHGENRNSGKAFTGVHDNDDLAVVEQVQEILAANPDAFGHVRFGIARDNLTATMQVSGWILGIAHGHMGKATGTAEQKLRSWWQGQAAGRQPIGDADILVTGHYHHLRVADWGGCLWLQAPALDGGSEYWRSSTGERAQAGMLTFLVDEAHRATDIAVL